MTAGSADRRPVLVGVGQLVQRDGPLEEALSALEMSVAVAQRAASDAGGGRRLLERVDTLVMLNSFGRGPGNPVRPLAEKLGAYPCRELITEAGGQIGVTAANAAAKWILRGKAEVVLLIGANDLRTRLRARRAGVTLPCSASGPGEPECLGELRPGHSKLEARYGLDTPSRIYPLFENALRARRGLEVEQHTRRMAHLFSRFSEVAARNPYAWFPTARSPEEIATATPQNRMICFPYTKYLNAILHTDQAAALLLCSADAAQALGVPQDRWVYWWGGAQAQEEAWFASERPDLSRCPAMLDAHQATLERAGLGIEDVDLLDFYSCFPVAVELAAEQLGLAETDPRGFTVTGGLPYAGGPASAYCLHSLASMAEKLRLRPGSQGFLTGNGWYLTKHAASLWSSAPPQAALLENREPATPASLRRGLARAPVAIDPEPTGTGRVEAYTVVYDRGGAPVRGILLGRCGENQRFLAWAPQERDVLESLTTAEGVGRPGRLSQKDGTTRFDPC